MLLGRCAYIPSELCLNNNNIDLFPPPNLHDAHIRVQIPHELTTWGPNSNTRAPGRILDAGARDEPVGFRYGAGGLDGVLQVGGGGFQRVQSTKIEKNPSLYE